MTSVTSSLLKTLIGLAAVATFSVPAVAANITFDEFAPDNFNQGALQSNRYAALGVTFTGTDDGSTWGGNSAGNPGNWGLEGTNGEAFSGYNGASYGTTITFAAIAKNVSFDVSRSNGSSAGDTFTFDGYLASMLVDHQTITLQDINTWSTVLGNFAGGYDTLVFSAAGQGFHPYGVDNLAWNAAAVPEPQTYALMLLGLGVVGAMARRRRG